MAEEIKDVKKPTNQKKKWQAELVEAIKIGNFKKAANLRINIEKAQK